VTTPLGNLDSEIALDWIVGSQVEVLIRPDDVIYDPQGPVKAQVIRRAFKGAEIMYTLRTSSQITLLALFPSHTNFEIDDEVSVRLEVDHLVVFPKESIPD
jgi:iron(III) transport system ATP-binding protein